MPAITTEEGTQIYYKDLGPKDAQPVVFQKRQEALRAKHIDEGEKAHKLGNFAQAALSYREALRIRTDEALAEKIRLAEAGKYLSNKDDQ